jgi:3-oxoacyl-[acyl-carrier-protein] synthase II
MGVVSSNGMGCEAFTAALRAGRSGVSELPFDSSMLQTHHAACVKGFEAGRWLSVQDIRRTPRTVHLATAASQEALSDAGLLDKPELLRQTGVMLGSGGGGLAYVEEQYRKYFTGDRGYSPFTITAGTHGNLPSELSIHFGLHGPSHCVSTGCASSTDALATAAMHIRAGTAPLFLVGGSDAPVAEGILKGFELMRILAKEREPASAMSRPFAKDRDGFVLGEGAWMFVLEDAEHAERRGAKVLAEVMGYGCTCDAYHRVQPAPDAGESSRAITLALANAGMTPDQFDYVNLHGTSTQMNDALETLAMHKALGEMAKKIPMSATKSMIGHPQGACGAAGVAATILSIRAGFLHPTINLAETDPGCDLDYIPNEARTIGRERPFTALCNTIAFGS